VQPDSIPQTQVSRRTFVRALLWSGAGLAAMGYSGALLNSKTRLAHATTSAEKQAEVDEVAAKLSAWEAELQAASDNYYYALEAHDAAIAAMNEAQGRIDAAQYVIAETQVKLGNRANNMYKNGKLSFLDVLFGASSFEQFTTSWDILNGINRENAELIAQNKDAKQIALDAHTEYTAQEQIANEKLAEAERIKAEAEAIVVQYQAELAGLEAEVAELVRLEQEAEAKRKAELEAAASQNGYFNMDFGGSGGADTIVAAAYSQLGVPYVWGGNGDPGFDCSGLTQWCYAQAGISIGRTDGAQYAGAAAILPLSEAIPGDILWTSGHVGICISYGGGTYIDAPYPGQVVSVNSWPQFSCALRY